MNGKARQNFLPFFGFMKTISGLAMNQKEWGRMGFGGQSDVNFVTMGVQSYLR
jgi:hypothetical protein